MTTTKPQSTTETLEPCPFCGKEAKGFWDGPYVHISGPPDSLQFYSIVCNACCSTAAYESKDRAVNAWNTRAPASTAPVVNNDAVGLNLLRQRVGGKNSLRTLKVFPCNQAEHEDVDCKCFWEQCEAWARQDAAATAAPDAAKSAAEEIAKYLDETTPLSIGGVGVRTFENIIRRHFDSNPRE